MSWVRPRAGSIAFPRFAPGIDADRLVDELARDAGVLLAPGRMFGRDDGHVRIGFGRENLPEALRRFETFLGGWH